MAAGWDVVSPVAQDVREGTWWRGGDGVSQHGVSQHGVAGTECSGRSQAGRVTPWSGGPGVGRDLPGSTGCPQPLSHSPLSPRRCRPRGRVPALPGEWAPGPPGPPHSPVPWLPGTGGLSGPCPAGAHGAGAAGTRMGTRS